VLEPSALTAQNGTTFTNLPDYSVLATGKNPDSETYTFIATTHTPEITAVRLEVLPDSSMVKNGPGRAANGNFALSDFRLEFSKRLDAASAPNATNRAPFKSARADFEQKGLPVSAAIDLTQFEGMPNAVLLEENIVGGGPPPWEVLERAAAAGFKSVIDLRRPEEGTEVEKSMVEKLGMRYYSVIVTPRTLSRYQADDVAEILKKPDNLPAILHCESGNRSGALWALYLNLYQDVEADKALAQGIQKGLRGRTLKEITREIMENEAAHR
jgi:protein tyrosine phosphatase (PTP) superfamily phosphohydrolase (DUF442 family)